MPPDHVYQVRYVRPHPVPVPVPWDADSGSLVVLPYREAPATKGGSGGGTERFRDMLVEFNSATLLFLNKLRRLTLDIQPARCVVSMTRQDAALGGTYMLLHSNWCLFANALWSSPSFSQTCPVAGVSLTCFPVPSLLYAGPSQWTPLSM